MGSKRSENDTADVSRNHTPKFHG